MIGNLQQKTPLFDAMVSLAESRNVSFHTPGHKSGKGISTRFRKFVGPRIFTIDLTTLDEVDSLQKPRGVIKQAHELAAQAYGADASFFLTNGTSGGNHAMMLTACPPDREVLVARNAHKSILAGLILSGGRPIFFSPDVNPGLKLSMNVSFAGVKAAIDANPQAKTLILTSPNYFGVAADLETIVSYAHQRGVVVLVDEAHGPHLHFHSKLPASAMAAGADLSVQSTHKIIGGMTQASMLHAQGERIDKVFLSSALRQTQSTSPSYILMASLDLARMQMATEGEKLLDKAIGLAESARARINKIPGFFCFDKNAFGKPPEGNTCDLDVTKLTLSVEGLGLSGFEVLRILNEQYRIQVEMADPAHVLVIVSIGDRQEDLDGLIDALQEISKHHFGQNPPADFQDLQPPSFGEATKMTPRAAFFHRKEHLPLEKAEGAVCADIVTVYPPGIPVLIPGEVITQGVVSYLIQMIALGGLIDGLEQDRTIEVVS
ncbi:MAG: aminotransferase class I/II-fold pyridoxal phosphate-dependent enzyme [Nitrospiria bacterium]